MKKIISRYYFIIAFLLVIADQKFSGLVLSSDFALGLSSTLLIICSDIDVVIFLWFYLL